MSADVSSERPEDHEELRPPPHEVTAVYLLSHHLPRLKVVVLWSFAEL